MKRILRHFRASRVERDLAAEIQAHLEEKADDLTADGMRPEEARSEAYRQFGNRTQIVESSRGLWVFSSIDEIEQDIRYAMRMLRKSPLFAAVGVVSLALGIAANTIIFSAVNHVVLHTLPYPQSERLYAVWSRSESHGVEPMHVSAADFYDWRVQSPAFESMAAFSSWPMNLTNVDEPRRLETQLVSASLFTTLGVRPEIGRTFLPDEDRENSAPVVIISHRLWRSLGESPQIVGTQITLNGLASTVIAVMPAGFAFPSPETDGWVPLSLSAQNRANREARWLSVIGRMRAGASPRDIAVELKVVTSRLATDHPKTNRGWSASIVPLQQQVVGRARPILLTLQASSLLLLLIACVNIANLLLARGASRAREIGVRAALGAPRTRILRQLLVESTVLAALGGMVGLTLAAAGIHMVRISAEELLPRASEIHLSMPVALFAVTVTLTTVLVFGLAPAWHASRVDLREQVGSGVRGPSHTAERKRGLLVAVEVGLASILLVGAGLVGQSLTRLLWTDPGLRTDHLLTLRLTLAHSQYPTNSAQNAFFEHALESVRQLPGVLMAGEVSETPLKGNNPTLEFALEGVASGPSDPPTQAGLRAISRGYLQTAGMTLIHGRDFTIDDRSGTEPVAIVNEAMARRFWPGTNPVGRRIRFREDERWMSLIGVVTDTKHMGLQANEGPVLYIPYAQKTQEWLAWTTLLIRTAGDPLQAVADVRAAIRGIDKNQPIAEISTLEQVIARSTAVPRFTTAVIAAVAGFALLIAVVGVYGLLAYTVARRMPELGIRLTLGASPWRVSRLLLRQAMLRVIAGVTAGLLAAWWLARWLESLLFGVRPHDPATYIGVASLLLLSSLAALMAPIRRALSMDPAAALRAE